MKEAYKEAQAKSSDETLLTKETDQQSKISKSLLLEAVKTNDPFILKEMIKIIRGEETPQSFISRHTGLIVDLCKAAASEGYAESIQCLLKELSGVGANLSNIRFGEVVIVAIRNGQVECLKTLFEYSPNASLHRGHFNEAFWIAVRNGDTNVVKALFQASKMQINQWEFEEFLLEDLIPRRKYEEACWKALAFGIPGDSLSDLLTEKRFNQIVATCVSEKSWQALTFFLENFPQKTLSQKIYDSIFDKYDHEDANINLKLFSALLSKHPTMKPSQPSFKAALRLAIEKNNLSLSVLLAENFKELQKN